MIDTLIDGAATPLTIVAFIAAAFVATSWRDWLRPARPLDRADNRIPPEERRLLGDDWRDCVRRPR
jgi:hypothetical protein